MTVANNIEHTIITKFRKKIWRPFSKAIKDYQLISENDKVAVCISGGKDSFILAKLMQELQKHGDKKFDLVFMVMDPGYEEEHLQKIKDNANLLNVPIKIFKSDIFAVSTKLNKDHPCYMCARMRRGFLYNKAQELGCNKIALGHHFDDVIETIMLSILYGGEYKSMAPKIKSTNFENMELIRPLYLIHEENIIALKNYHHLEFINCACSFTKNKTKDSKRAEIKNLIAQLKKVNPNVEANIFKSSENVNINTILGYKEGNTKRTFIDEYNK